MTTLNAYRTPPQLERKAAKELREAGIRAYVPTEVRTIRGARAVKRRFPVAPGYVFAADKPHDAEHVRACIGSVGRSELARIYPRRDRGHKSPASPFAEGDSVTIQRGPFAQLTGTVSGPAGKRGWMVDVMLFGRPTPVAVAERYMRKHEPG
jgi:transcription antitermination factor NusG